MTTQPNGTGTTALVLSYFGFIVPPLAMVGIAIGAGHRGGRGGKAIAVGVLALLFWMAIVGIWAVGHVRVTTGGEYEQLKAEIGRIGR